MEEQRHDPGTPRRYEETTDPLNPPNSLMNRPVRRAVVWSYFVPIVVLFVVIGVALLYWSNRTSPRYPDNRGEGASAVGTVGAGQLSKEGGFDPAPRPRSTGSEIESRGEDLAPITKIGGLVDADPRKIAGRRVDLDDVDVESAQGNMFWVRDGDEKVAVIAPADAPQPRADTRVSVSGVAEPDDSGHVRIRASRIEIRK